MSTRRPRGESFSSSSARYVGHACRQKPQCTQFSDPGSGSAAARVAGLREASRERLAHDPGVEDVPRIELPLHALRQRVGDRARGERRARPAGRSRGAVSTPRRPAPLPRPSAPHGVARRGDERRVPAESHERASLELLRRERRERAARELVQARTRAASPRSRRSTSRRPPGRARSRTLTSVITPSVPHEPTSSRVRSKPATFFTTRPPARTTAPVPSTNSMPMARSRGAPSEALHGPSVAVARVAPSVPAVTAPREERAPLAVRRASPPRVSAMVVPARAVSVRSPGTYSTIPAIAETSSAAASGATAAARAGHVPRATTRRRRAPVVRVAHAPCSARWLSAGRRESRVSSRRGEPLAAAVRRGRPSRDSRGARGRTRRAAGTSRRASRRGRGVPCSPSCRCRRRARP